MCIRDRSITALTVTILTQKIKSISPNLDQNIMEGLAHLALKVNRSEFRLLMKFFHTVTNNALEPVSYTHLDVYKRQLHDSGNAKLI